MLQQTVLDTATGAETTYFSNGTALRVNDDGVSLFWSKRNYQQQATVGEFFGSAGETVTFNPNTGSYKSVMDGHNFMSWRNGFVVNEFHDGAVKLSSKLDSGFRMSFDNAGNLESSSLTAAEQSAFQKQLPGIGTADGTMFTGLKNGLVIKELPDGGVNVLRRYKGGLQELLNAKPDGTFKQFRPFGFDTQNPYFM
jgi:hypothetical protein